MTFEPEHEYGQIFYCTSDSFEDASRAAMVYAKDHLPIGAQFDVYGPTKTMDESWEFCWKYPEAVSGFPKKRLVVI